MEKNPHERTRALQTRVARSPAAPVCIYMHSGIASGLTSMVQDRPESGLELKSRLKIPLGTPPRRLPLKCSLSQCGLEVLPCTRLSRPPHRSSSSRRSSGPPTRLKHGPPAKGLMKSHCPRWDCVSSFYLHTYYTLCSSVPTPSLRMSPPGGQGHLFLPATLGGGLGHCGFSVNICGLALNVIC